MHVGVLVSANPKSGSATTFFGIHWGFVGSLRPAEVHDVQVAFCADAGCTPSFRDWKTGTPDWTGGFVSGDPAWQGPGTYFFRARLRDTVTGAASDWSPVLTITVTP